VNHDLRRLVGLFYAEEPLDHRLFLGPGLARIDLDDTVFVAPIEESLGLDERIELRRVGRVPRNLRERTASIACAKE
jgi:hypothetical protein